MTTGTIYNLSYRRYEGTRLPAWTRPLVIARYALTTQWRQRGVKIALLLSLLSLAVTAVVVGGIWFFSNAINENAHEVQRAVPDVMREANAMLVTASLRSQFLPSFLLVLLCGAPAISKDLNAGAFQFHFARPVGVPQYLLGRLLSAGGWALLPPLVTVAALSVERLALGGEPLALLALSAKAAVAVVLRVAVLASVALGVSSLTRRAGLAQALFAALVLGTMFIASAVASATNHVWVAALDVVTAPAGVAAVLTGAAQELHGWQKLVPALACAAWIAGGLALAAQRLRTAEVMRG
ncbi:MAG: hypothetical protein R3A52_23850 [Polyangiales bacterium]